MLSFVCKGIKTHCVSIVAAQIARLTCSVKKLKVKKIESQ